MDMDPVEWGRECVSEFCSMKGSTGDPARAEAACVSDLIARALRGAKF